MMYKYIVLVLLFNKLSKAKTQTHINFLNLAKSF